MIPRNEIEGVKYFNFDCVWFDVALYSDERQVRKVYFKKKIGLRFLIYVIYSASIWGILFLNCNARFNCDMHISHRAFLCLFIISLFSLLGSFTGFLNCLYWRYRDERGFVEYLFSLLGRSVIPLIALLLAFIFCEVEEERRWLACNTVVAYFVMFPLHLYLTLPFE